MGVIDRMRRQNAIYWPPNGTDGFGRPAFGALVVLAMVDGVNRRVRWEDSTEEFLSDELKENVRASAIVYVPQLPGGTEVEVGGCLWLGDRADLADELDPKKNEKAFEVMRFDMLPDFKAKQMLRTCYLCPSKD